MFKEKTVANINGVDYYILLNDVILGVRYIYASEYEDDDITERFNIFKEVVHNKFEVVSDGKELRRILPIILQLINERMQEEE